MEDNQHQNHRNLLGRLNGIFSSLPIPNSLSRFFLKVKFVILFIHLMVMATGFYCTSFIFGIIKFLRAYYKWRRLPLWFLHIGHNLLMNYETLIGWLFIFISNLIACCFSENDYAAVGTLYDLDKNTTCEQQLYLQSINQTAVATSNGENYFEGVNQYGTIFTRMIAVSTLLGTYFAFVGLSFYTRNMNIMNPFLVGFVMAATTFTSLVGSIMASHSIMVKTPWYHFEVYFPWWYIAHYTIVLGYRRFGPAMSNDESQENFRQQCFIQVMISVVLFITNFHAKFYWMMHFGIFSFAIGVLHFLQLKYHLI